MEWWTTRELVRVHGTWNTASCWFILLFSIIECRTVFTVRYMFPRKRLRIGAQSECYQRWKRNTTSSRLDIYTAWSLQHRDAALQTKYESIDKIFYRNDEYFLSKPGIKAWFVERAQHCCELKCNETSSYYAAIHINFSRPYWFTKTRCDIPLWMYSSKILKLSD